MSDIIRSIWSIRVILGDRHKTVVFRKNIGECYNNAVFWMYENIAEVEAVLEKYIDFDPQVVLEDIFVSEDN